MTKIFKKTLAILLCAVLLLSLFTACSKKNDVYQIGVIQSSSNPAFEKAYDGVLMSLLASSRFNNVERKIASAGSMAADCENFVGVMVADGYDMIIAIDSAAAAAAKKVLDSTGSKIPLVFCIVGDAVDESLVQSLEEPGGNVSGAAAAHSVEMQLDLIKTVQSDVQRIGVLFDEKNSSAVNQLIKLEQLAQQHDVEIISRGVEKADSIEAAARSVVTQVDCVLLLNDSLLVANFSAIEEHASAAGIPLYGCDAQQIELGAAAATGVDYSLLGTMAGQVAFSIMHGASPKTTPVKTMDKIGLYASKSKLEQLGCTVPDDGSVTLAD